MLVTPQVLAAYRLGRKTPGFTLPCLCCELEHPSDVCARIHAECTRCDRPGHFAEECHIFRDNAQRFYWFLMWVNMGVATSLNPGGVLTGR